MLYDYETLLRGKRYRPKSNYHGHNYMCGHAAGTVCDYVKAAIESGLEVIGISDHCVPPIGSYEPYITLDTLVGEYLPQFAEAERKYGDKITIKKGVEIEFFPDCDEYYNKLLDKLDYLVMGQHEFLMNGSRMSSFFDGTDEKKVCAYLENVIRGIESGYFALVAHPDLILYRNPAITTAIERAFDNLVQSAKNNSVPLELNANGVRNHGFRYPTEILVRLCKKHGAPVVVSSDCHMPKEVCDGAMIDLYTYAKAKGLNVVDEI